MRIKWILTAFFFFSCIPTLIHCLLTNQERVDELKAVLRSNNENIEVYSVSIFPSEFNGALTPEVEVRLVTRRADGSIDKGAKVHYHVQSNRFWADTMNEVREYSQINTRGLNEPTRGFPGAPVAGGRLRTNLISADRVKQIKDIVQAAVGYRDEQQNVQYYDALMSKSPNVPPADLETLFKTDRLQQLAANPLTQIQVNARDLINQQQAGNRENRELQRIAALKQQQQQDSDNQALAEGVDDAIMDFEEQIRREDAALKQQQQDSDKQALEEGVDDVIMDFEEQIRREERRVDRRRALAPTNERRRSLSPQSEKETETAARSRSPSSESEAETAERRRSESRDRLEAAAAEATP